MTTLPIVIVGAGPAGLTTALSLARWAPALAARVIVLDKARFPREKTCAGALGERGWRALRALEAAPSVPGVEVRGFQVVSSEPPLTSRRSTSIGRVIRRLEFDAALAARAVDMGVHLEEEVRVIGVQERQDHVSLTTNKGELRAEVVVGADGVGSVVRRSMDQPHGGLRVQVVEVDTEPVPSDPPRDLLTFDISDHGYAGYSWHFPTLVEGAPMMCRGVYALRPDDVGQDTAERRARPDIAGCLSTLLRARGLDPRVHRFARFSERGFRPGTRLVQGRRMLVGEAAGIDPLAGEGLAHSLEYGTLAGRFLAQSQRTPGALAGWHRALTRSRLGWDLALCHRLLRRFYGAERRHTEALLFSHDHLLSGCLHRFAGELPSPWLLARAATAVGKAWAMGRAEA